MHLMVNKSNRSLLLRTYLSLPPAYLSATPGLASSMTYHHGRKKNLLKKGKEKALDSRIELF